MQINIDTQPELGLSVTEAARRAQIIGATIETIAELGYGRTSFTRIMERAGLSSSRLISYHFGTKAALMQAVLGTVIHLKDEFLAGHTRRPLDRIAALRAYIESEVAFLAAHPKLVRTMTEIGAWSRAGGDTVLELVVRDQRVGRLERQLRQGRQEGVFTDFAPDVMATAIAQAIDGVVAEYTVNPRLDLNHYGRELAGLFERAARA